ncbi:MAG: TrbC/VirB2 family protein [Candidatus Saccharimonadales bacterium]
MIKKLKLLALSFSSFLMIGLPLAVTGAAFAQTPIDQNQINNNLCAGSNGQFDQGVNGTTTGCGTGAATHVNSLVTTVVNVLSVVVGIIAVIMIIVAGLRYITSGGKQESVTGAKNTILYAVIGLVIVALAQLIVHFVLNKTTTATS